jgi:hypothetical protein
MRRENSPMTFQRASTVRGAFATLRLRLLKIAARVVETATRIRLAFAAACPEADLIHGQKSWRQTLCHLCEG